MTQGPGPFAWVALCLGAWLALSTLVLVSQGQRSVVSRFGVPVRVLEPGMHVKWPWPVEHVTGVDVSERRTIGDTLAVVTRDPAMFDLPLQLAYDVDDPARYVATGKELAETTLKQLAREAVLRHTGAATLPALAGRDGVLDGDALKTLQARALAVGLGVRPLEVKWTVPTLPAAVRTTGDALKAIQAERDRAIADAGKSSETDARQWQVEANAIAAAAERDRQAVIIDARADAAHFKALAEQYRANPATTRDVVLQSAFATGTPGTAGSVAVASAASAAPAAPATASPAASANGSREVDRSVDRTVDRSVDRTRSAERGGR